jgi:Organic solute transporter Ostalpha
LHAVSATRRPYMCPVQVHYAAWFIAGIFVLLAIPVTVYEVALHLEHFTRPKLQIRVIRILWMVPIYALDSFLTLRFVQARRTCAHAQPSLSPKLKGAELDPVRHVHIRTP